MFDYSSFMPHGHCYLWRPDILWLNVISDGLIALAYFSIPIALFYFIRKRKDLTFKSMFALFGLFIVLCGITHVVGAYTVWVPNYGMEGLFKAATAVVSLMTAGLLWPIIPKALKLPSPSQLNEKNRELKILNETLEEKVERRVRDSRQLAAIVNSSQDAIISKDLNGVVTTWNKGAEDLFQYTADEMIGQLIQKIVPNEIQEEEGNILKEVRNGRTVKPFDTIRVKKDGTEVHVSATISPIYSENGEILGASSVTRDISERIELEAALKSSNEDIKKTQIAKDEFIANLSHELRSPINIILGYAGIIKTIPPDTEDFSKAIDSIQRTAETQLHLIEDILDMSRIISGKFSLNIQNNDVRSIVSNAVKAVEHSANIKGITIQTKIEENNHTLVCDADRLQQILWNLLSNAVKFTQKNGHILVRAKRADGYFEFEVTDNGRGIRKQDIPYLFERLWQSEEESLSKKGGLGLGLKIVKDLVSAHGGKVEVKSDGPGTGATFIIQIPVLATSKPSEDSEDNKNSQSESQSGLLHGMNILIVDDSPDALDVLSYVLKNEGANIVRAVDGVEALEIIRDNNIDFIISDINMPNMDGYAFIQKTRIVESKTGRTPRPAIALTARTGKDDNERSRKSGYHLHLVKPVQPKDLVGKIVEIIKSCPISPI